MGRSRLAQPLTASVPAWSGNGTAPEGVPAARTRFLASEYVYSPRSGPWPASPSSPIRVAERISPRGRILLMKNVRRFSLLFTLVTMGALLPACTQDDSAPPATTTSSLAPPSAPARPALPYYGVVDRSNCDIVSGWVTNTTDPKASLKVELYIDDQLAET